MVKNMRRTIFAVIITVAVFVATVFLIFFLWWTWLLPLPAIIVRNVGCLVTSLERVRGSSVVELSVPWYRQEHALSCEVASLRMAIASFGVSVSEADLIRNLPFDPTPKHDNIWGDPNTGFVGNINGSMFATGYGVYWNPIARLGLRYRRTEVIRGAEPKDLAHQVSAGRPVIIWGIYGRPRQYQWQTPDGKSITGVNGEHARVVVGFTGSVDEPTSFILLDPIFGRLVWSTKTLRANWDLLGRNGVVVYPHPRWARVNGETQIWEIAADGQTRHRVPSWEAFVAQGGFQEAIVTIDATKLIRYKEEL